MPIFLILNFSLSTVAAYNPLEGKAQNIPNLEKARILLDHFHKSGIDSEADNDIKANKDIVQLMLESCRGMTDQEKTELSQQEQQEFMKYFEKLYHILQRDTQELNEIFEIAIQNKPVDEIYNEKDKRIEYASNENFEQSFFAKNKKVIAVISAIAAVIGFLLVMLTKSLKRIG